LPYVAFLHPGVRPRRWGRVASLRLGVRPRYTNPAKTFDRAGTFTYWTLREAAMHMQMIADPLADAIAKQFPGKFAN